MNFPQWFAPRHPLIPFASAEAVLKLVESGATVPFIARYRKEETGNLDEVAIRQAIDARDSWDEIAKRQAFIVEEIERQGKLTPELREQLLSAFELAVLEDLYLPYKLKRKTKATVAKEAGLEALASWLWDCAHDLAAPGPGETPETRALAFCDADKGVPDVDAALAGATDILTERLSEDARLRQAVRSAFFENGYVRARRADKAKPNSRFDQYFAHQEPVAELLKPRSSHRYLAMRRGWMEEELALSVGGALPRGEDADAPREGKKAAAPMDPLLERLGATFDAAACSQPLFAGAPLLERAAHTALRAYVVPAIETEVHKALRDGADLTAIEVFAENVRKLLLSAPFGPKAVLGVDPGLRTGCKLAVVDGSGAYVGSAVMHLESPSGKAGAAPMLADLVGKGGIRAVAVGNGTAGRETEGFVREALASAGLGEVPVVMVSEAGASVYSASDVAREEFPELDVTVRGAISIARRLQDPLAELVKIDPKSIGVGQYQHDVSPHALRKSLAAVIDSCVNLVGVNLNTASYHLLSHVSGIGPGLARAIVEQRAKAGLFRSRTQLLEVPRFSKRVFEQAAGFLRIPEADHPLDNTGVHPERYAVLEALAARLGVATSDLLGSGVKLVKAAEDLKREVGAFTFDDIVKELEKPGRDPRGRLRRLRLPVGRPRADGPRARHDLPRHRHQCHELRRLRRHRRSPGRPRPHLPARRPLREGPARGGQPGRPRHRPRPRGEARQEPDRADDEVRARPGSGRHRHGSPPRASRATSPLGAPRAQFAASRLRERAARKAPLQQRLRGARQAAPPLTSSSSHRLGRRQVRRASPTSNIREKSSRRRLAVRTLAGKQPEEVHEAHDRDALEPFQLEKMPITGHDEIRSSFDSALENPIVCFVVDDRDLPGRLHDPRRPTDLTKRLLDIVLILIELHSESASGFRQDRDGRAELEPPLPRESEGMVGSAARNYQRRDEDVRVEDHPHQRSSNTRRSTSFSVNTPLARARRDMRACSRRNSSSARLALYAAIISRKRSLLLRCSRLAIRSYSSAISGDTEKPSTRVRRGITCPPPELY